MKSIIYCIACFLFLIPSLFITTSSFGETTCEIKDCQIKITIKIAYVGATDAQIQSWTNEIEDTWNGDGQVTGDCNCPVSFEVETMKITDQAQANCNPGPTGYHCVMVTPYATNPPVDTTGKKYPAYMYPPGIARNGESLKGWWSDITNRPVDPNDPSKGIYHDASHEAGHIMGLDQNEGDGLMKVTWGENAKPTQGNIDSAVGYVCGADACPDRCCCGNGTIEEDKGESCDPFAEPDAGCEPGEYCCVECCSCYAQICIAEDGEYNTYDECVALCTGNNSSCYQNYKTGCWDCVTYGQGENKKVYTESFSIKEGEHLWYFKFKSLRELIGYDFSHIPELVQWLSDTPFNLYVEGTDGYSVITLGTEIWEVNDFLLTDPLAMVYTDKKTIEDIMNEYRTVGELLASGRLIINIWPFDYLPEPQFVRPLDGTTVEGNVFIAVMEAREATDILQTSFEVCNAAGACEFIGTDTDGTFGWGIEWNTDTPLYPNGPYQLKATMTDFAGDEGMAVVGVEVFNEPSGAEPAVNIAVDQLGGIVEGGTLTFNVTQTEPSGSDTTVTVYLAEGTAVAVEDYTDNSPYTVTILAGDTTANLTVDVPTVDDNADEPSSEYFTATINDAVNPTGVTIGTPSAIGEILDNDEPPQNILADGNENVFTPEDTTLTGNVLNNTINPDGPAIASVVQFSVAGNTYNAGQTANINGIGTLTINQNGSYTFTPVENYNGPVPVATYNVTDGEDTETSTLSMTVHPDGDPPDAIDDNYQVNEGDTLTITLPAEGVLNNDSDGGDGGTKIVVSNTYPAHGTLTLNHDGTFTYEHDGSNTTSDSFHYTMTDGDAQDTATVNITINPLYYTTMSVGGAPVHEGDWAQFSVQITDAAEGGLVTLTLTDGGGANDPAEAFIDYNPAPFFYRVDAGPEEIYTGAFPVTAGSHVIAVLVETLADPVIGEPDEDFTLTAEVLNPEGTVATDSGQATIIDDLPPG